MMVSTVRRWPCAPSAAGAQTSWTSRMKRVLPTSLLPFPEHVERGIVHEPVGAHERAGVDRALTTQAGGASPCLLHDHLEGGDVPWVHDLVNSDLTRAFGDQPGACRPGIIPLLFPEQAEAGLTPPRERAGHLLDGLVHLGDGAVVGFLLDLEAGRPEAAQRKLVGPVSDLVEQREPAIGPHAGAGLPRSLAPASCRAPAARAAPRGAAGQPLPAGRPPRRARRARRRASPPRRG